jgi:hypothetical protein
MGGRQLLPGKNLNKNLKFKVFVAKILSEISEEKA